MSDFFKILEIREPEGDGKAGVRLGIDLRIGDKVIECPVSALCRTKKDLAREIQGLQTLLDRVREEGNLVLQRKPGEHAPVFSPDTPSHEIWSFLSRIAEEDVFAETFNAMDEALRSRVAEYVLSHCSLFSGKGAVFSARYDNETRRME